MDRHLNITSIVLRFITVAIALVLWSCANRGYPEGGPKDSTPPKVTLELPASFTENFDKKYVNIYFDEFVQLKNMTEKFIISPPQTKKPKVRLKGKYVQVEFVDTLKPGTTYSLDFADAIVDNNESNPMGFYRYVLSTGSGIDSLELSGNVVDAESGDPMLNTYVFLYSTYGDSVALKQLPDYMARTDSSGFFKLTNLKSKDYKIIAVDDANRDYKFLPEGEAVAFIDSLVRPVVMEMSRTDTIHDEKTGLDSIVKNEYLAFGPNNLYLRMFMERPTQLYLVDGVRKQREKMDFVFSIPGNNEFSIRGVDGQLLPENWYVQEHSAGNDTLQLWITDSTVYRQDTLRLLLNYLRSDSLGQHVAYNDTVRYIFSDKKPASKSRKKTEEKAPTIDFLKSTISVGTEQDLNQGITFEFERPIREDSLKHIRLFEKVDTIYQPIDYRLRRDSLRLRRFTIEKPWKAEGEYMLQVDSAVIYDIYGRHNDKIEKKFKVRAQEYYGKVMLNVKGLEGRQAIVQLYKADAAKGEKGKRTFSVVAEAVLTSDGIVDFDYLQAGKYCIRAIIDNNRNGKWDTGLYMGHLQPEEVLYLPSELNVKQNFDVEQDFDLNLPYKK